jgi:hypothetical protein
MPLDSVCEPVAAFPKELTGDLAVGWPSAGKPAGNIARGVRCFPAGKYLIYYRNTRGVLVGLGGLEPPTSPLSVVKRPSITDCDGLLWWAQNGAHAVLRREG